MLLSKHLLQPLGYKAKMPWLLIYIPKQKYLRVDGILRSEAKQGQTSKLEKYDLFHEFKYQPFWKPEFSILLAPVPQGNSSQGPTSIDPYKVPHRHNSILRAHLNYSLSLWLY